MKLIEWNFWILKEHNNFSCLWKFEPNIPNSFGEIVFENLQNLQTIYELINVTPESWNLPKLHKITSSFNLWT